MILLRENLGPATMIHNPLVEGSNPSGGTYNAGESGLPQSSLLLRPNLRFTDPLSNVKEVPLGRKPLWRTTRKIEQDPHCGVFLFKVGLNPGNASYAAA